MGVLFDEVVVTPEAGFVAVHTPTNPTFWWGNLLVFPNAPAAGDETRWLELWSSAFGDRFEHRTFAWDRADGVEGDVAAFERAGFEVERSAVLVAAPEAVRPPRKDTSHVIVREIDLQAEREQLVDLSMVVGEEVEWSGERPETAREHNELQFRRRARHTAEGRGFWLGAFSVHGELVAALGVLSVGEGLARYQQVDTHPEWRRQGLCSRLLHDSARLARDRFDVRELAIVADREYHALDLYRSAGFEVVEHTVGLCRRPGVQARA